METKTAKTPLITTTSQSIAVCAKKNSSDLRMDTYKLLMLMFGTILRYAIVAGIAYFIFYIWKKEKFLLKKIQNTFPEKKKITWEVKYSLLNGVIFGFFATGIFIANNYGYAKMYNDVSDHGWTWFWLSLLVQILIHDTWFYWTHRAMHHPKIFPFIHKVHHQSKNPTPWAAFSFHPLEAIISGAYFPVMVYLIPIHLDSVLLFSTFMLLMNVNGHLGFELFPRGFTKHKILGWYITSTHHNMHHRFVKCNYGFFFNFWDHVMGTNHVKYHEEFERVSSQEEMIFSVRELEKENIQPESKLI
jgi:sterol desaturase/sphingolipid hydroxylase (fatty acid hydroxylase superfamily)